MTDTDEPVLPGSEEIEPVAITNEPLVVLNRTTVRRVVTVGAAAFIVAAILFGWVLYRTYQIGSDAKASGDSAQSAAKTAQDQVSNGRKQRLANQELVKVEIEQLQRALSQTRASNQDLACSISIYIRSTAAPDDTYRRDFAQFLFDRYECRNYRPVSRPLSTTSPSGPQAAPNTPGTPNSQPSGRTGNAPVPRSSRAPQQGSTTTRTVPAPGRTSTRTVTPSQDPPASGSLTDELCRLRLICLR